jgi:hypothetical protein
MEIKEIIELAEKAAGSQKALALRIGQSAGKLREIKSGRCGLPVYACVMVADLINMDRISVIAASELVTEKKEERRRIWHPFVGHAASVILGIVILNMTTAPAQAATMQHKSLIPMYIMSNTLRKLIQKAAKVFAWFCERLPRTAVQQMDYAG